MEKTQLPRPLHPALLWSWRLGRLPREWTFLFIVLAALALAMATGKLLPAVLWLTFWSLADWLLLEALPRLGISYGTVQPTHLVLLVLRWLLAALGTAASGRWPWVAVPAWALQALLWGLAVYTLAIEPSRLGVTELTLVDGQAAPGARPLSILQIGDLHIERLTRREWRILQAVDRLQPDLILLTGDYLNLSYIHDPVALAALRQFLRQLRARQGIYAVRGTPQVDPPWIMPREFGGLPITVLEGARRELEIDGHRLCLVGVGCNSDLTRDGAALRAALAGAADDRYTILLYHMPDLMEAASAAGVNLYLAGHTHGGQLRLPFYGALVTASQLGKRYEMGAYRLGRTCLYVARGVGLEGMGAPRGRFLCPPEIVHIRLESQARSGP